ncbi:helix-turn-helix transcriptional regulator [Brevibacillus reuszeri]|uniref:helix-turn-helix transcriptional regulator n=1 Tax=Brevibacillus reuszeri TaxID=54915 RepID=UPI002896C04F|nr:YafY family protein [Brevibacillus reuszeri]
MKLERLLAIIMMLLNRRRLSARELADHFEVSLRTIYRDLDAINAAGIPIVAYPGSSGGYEIMESFTIDRQYLSLEELVAVIAALKGVHSSTEDKQIGQLLEKINALLSTSSPSIAYNQHPVVYDFNPWGSTPAIAQKVSTLRDAIARKMRVSIVYTKIGGQSEERTIEPISLIIKGYVWYVYAYCRRRMEYRLFRLSRIEQLVVLTEEFMPHKSEVDKLVWQEDWDTGPRVELVLRFAPAVHVRVRDMFQPETIEIQEDGYLLVRTVMADDEWLHGMLLSYGESLFVLEPAYIKERMGETIKKMLLQYEKASNVDR